VKTNPVLVVRTPPTGIVHVNLDSWDTAIGIAPIFEMNLPEGALHERLCLAFAKAISTFADFDLLAIV
jgi:serine/threonine-protein kinase HipA